MTKRDKIKGKENLWKGSVWVQNEISMAYTLRKPIAVCVEENVQLEPSIAPFITDCLRFNRRDLNFIKKKAKSYIEALCKEISSNGSHITLDKTVDNIIVQDIRGKYIQRCCQ